MKSKLSIVFAIERSFTGQLFICALSICSLVSCTPKSEEEKHRYFTIFNRSLDTVELSVKFDNIDRIYEFALKPNAYGYFKPSSTSSTTKVFGTSINGPDVHGGSISIAKENGNYLDSWSFWAGEKRYFPLERVNPEPSFVFDDIDFDQFKIVSIESSNGSD